MVARTTAFLIQFLRNEDGPTATEYAFMLALIILVCLVAIGAIGAATNNNFNQLNNNLNGS